MSDKQARKYFENMPYGKDAKSSEIHGVENQKIITLLEGKNTKDKFPSPDMVVEQLVKLMIFKKCDFQKDIQNQQQPP